MAALAFCASIIARILFALVNSRRERTCGAIQIPRSPALFASGFVGINATANDSVWELDAIGCSGVKEGSGRTSSALVFGEIVGQTTGRDIDPLDAFVHIFARIKSLLAFNAPKRVAANIRSKCVIFNALINSVESHAN